MSDDCISRQAVKEQMIKYGFHAPDMTVTEFVEDLPPVNPQEPIDYKAQYESFAKKAEIVISQLRADRDRLADVFDKIRAEIDGIEINGQIDEHTMFIRTGEQVKQMALDIIDKYKAESENKE